MPYPTLTKIYTDLQKNTLIGDTFLASEINSPERIHKCNKKP